jgi:hypothetical protein
MKKKMKPWDDLTLDRTRVVQTLERFTHGTEKNIGTRKDASLTGIATESTYQIENLIKVLYTSPTSLRCAKLRKLF